MGWGTTFTTDIYISRRHFDSLADLDDAIKEYEDSIAWIEKRLLMFAASPPGDISELQFEVEEIIENLKHDITEVNRLYLLREVGLDKSVKD